MSETREKVVVFEQRNGATHIIIEQCGNFISLLMWDYETGDFTTMAFFSGEILKMIAGLVDGLERQQKYEINSVNRYWVEKNDEMERRFTTEGTNANGNS